MPEWKEKIRRRLAELKLEPTREAEIVEELSQHLDDCYEESLASGATRDEATRRTLAELSEGETLQRELRRVERPSPQEPIVFGTNRRTNMIADIWQDLRFGARMLLKKPGFTAIVALSMAIGIGANATIFSFVNELLLRPPSVERPGQLLEFWNHYRQGGSLFTSFEPLSYPEYEHYRDHNQVFSEMLAFNGDPAFISWSRQGQGEIIQGQYVSGNFFSCLGVRAALGRTFAPEEGRTSGTHPVVVLSHAFWQEHLGADPNVVGSTMRLNGFSFNVVGVAPKGFAGLVIGFMPDVWIPLMMGPQTTRDQDLLTRRSGHWIFGVGRLKPGLTLTQATADLNVLSRQLAQSYPKNNEMYEPAIFPATLLPGPVRGYVSAFSGLLMLVVALVLLIACANAASYLLARATARRREIAVRAALGASRSRLVRQTLAESLLLACFSGGLGWLLARWTAPLLLSLKPPTLPLRFDVSPDYRVFGFTLLVTLLAGLLFGLAPAWQGTRIDLATSLKDGASGGGARKSRLRSLLVVGQVAVCSLLLVGSGICLRSLLHAQSIDIGFETGNRLIATLDLSSLGYSKDKGKAFFDNLIERTKTIPGVESASLTSHLQLGTVSWGEFINVEGHQPPPGERGFTVNSMSVGPDFFKTMGTKVLRGREFTARDTEGAPGVVIINEEIARRFWPDRDPVGASLTMGSGKEEQRFEIVGVAQNGKYRSLGEQPRLFLYHPILQGYYAGATLVAKTSGDPASLMAAVRREIGALDPNLAPTQIDTLEEHMTFALFPARISGVLLGVFGLLALVLALVGLSGLIAYSVSQRTREIGVRMALGAGTRDVLKLVIGEGMLLTLIGMTVGLASALGLTRFLSDLLYGVSAIDPLTFGVIALLLVGVALLACWLPARRATKVDPMVALRCE
ncbi:MAG TPA: ABC transporter permease [Blastocatellia bacterium]|nr:ABC transporter permease [Blastocatellia bacterium]